MSELVRLTRTGAIASIEFRRPEKHNALDVDTAQAFLEHCLEVSRDDSIRVVVLAGEGRSFGVGGDLHALMEGGAIAARAIIEPLHNAVELLTGMDAPVIAKLRGIVAGGSMSLALGSDLAIASEDVRFNFAYTNAGTTPDLGGSWHLPRIVGLRAALEIALLNETIDAKQAQALGLINRVVPSDRLDSEVAEIASRLANGPTRAFGRLKRLMRQSSTNQLHRQLTLELSSFVESAKTSDFREAISAILARREAHFTGA